jgi:hypothetical protein
MRGKSNEMEVEEWLPNANSRGRNDGESYCQNTTSGGIGHHFVNARPYVTTNTTQPRGSQYADGRKILSGPQNDGCGWVPTLRLVRVRIGTIHLHSIKPMDVIEMEIFDELSL